MTLRTLFLVAPLAQLIAALALLPSLAVAQIPCPGGLITNCASPYYYNATIGGTLGVTGAATLGGSLTVNGATTFSGAGTGLAVTNNATIGGTLTLAHNPNTLNVRDYGAVGNGTTDDTAAIQTAATACPAAGCTLYFPPGYTFGVSGTLLLSSNTHILAYGATLLDISGNFSFLKNLHNSATTLTDSNITIEGGTLDYGTSGTGGGYHAIEMSFVNHAQVLNVICQLRGAGNCTAMIGTNDTLAQGNSSFGSTNAAFDHWWTPTNARVIGNYATMASGYPALFNPEQSSGSSPSGAQASGYVLEGNTFVCTGASNSCSIMVKPLGTGTTVRDVSIIGNSFSNVRLDISGAVTGAVVSGNVFDGMNDAANVIANFSPFNGGYSDSVSVNGNTIINPQTGAGNYAVIVVEATNSGIVGNTVSGTPGACYAATYSSTYPVVIGGNSGWGNCTYADTGTAWVSNSAKIQVAPLFDAGNNAGFNIPPTAAPIYPVNGDLWATTTGLFAQVNGSTVGPLLGPGSNASTTTTTATGSTTARTLAARASDRFSILDFGAKCDGTTDDSAAITAAMATGKTISIPSGLTCYGASISQAGITTTFVGPGQIKTSDGNLRAPIVSQISVRPNVGNWGAVTTAFNGNLSHVPYAIEQRITGTATLGQPTTGWSLTQEVAALAIYGYNASGWNNSTSSNVGRTGAGIVYLDVGQNGQGDYTGITCYGLVSSTLPGATSYLASPAVECMGGELFGGAAGSYIEYLGDMDIADNGFDIAAVGEVFGLARTNATGNLGANWVGSMISSAGTAPINQFQVFSGPSVLGANWTQENLSYATLAAYSVDGAGTGYTVGDILTSPAANAIAPTQIKVTSLGASNSIAGFSIVQSGIYTAAPAPSDTYPTGGTGSGFKFWASYAANNALLMPVGGCIRGSASNAANPAQTVVSLNDSVCFTTSGITIGTDGSNNMSGPAGANNTLIGSNSWALGKGTVGLGYGVYDDAQYNALLFSSGEFNYSAGTSQTSTRILRGVPTGTGAVRLTSDGNTAGSQNSYLVVAGSAHGLDIHVQAIDETNGDTAVWKWLDGEISRTSSGNATYQGDATTAMTPTYSTGAGGTATIQISADTTYQSLNVTFTPPTGNVHTWHVQAVVRGDKVQ